MADTSDQFTGIETKLAYLEDYINKLQAIAVEHTDAIDRLNMENRALRAKLGEVADAIQETPNLRPPHY